MTNLFNTGKLVMTKAIAEKREADDDFDLFLMVSLRRYRNGDWGDICEDDKKTNDNALENGERLMGVYIYDDEEIDKFCDIVVGKTSDDIPFKKFEDKDKNGLKIWIITEWDRSITTILFPDEY